MADHDASPRRRRSLGKTILQLVVASIIVGAILAVLDISPLGFWRGLFRSAQEALGILGENLSDVVRKLLSYLLLGAAIVLPIWIVVRLFKLGGRS